MSRVVHFEIGANDVQRACRFYQEVFGWTIQAGPENYMLATTGPATDMGIDGAIVARMGTASVVNTIAVADLDVAGGGGGGPELARPPPPFRVPPPGRAAP